MWKALRAFFVVGVCLVAGVAAPVSADWQDYCPWVGSSYLGTSCGNGTCDGVSPDVENESNCARDCSDALVMSYYADEVHCEEITAAVYPANEAAAVTAINAARTAGKHVVFAGGSHSGNELICNDGTVISSSNMRTIYGLETFQSQEVVRIDGGVMFWELVNWLYANNRAVDMPVTGFGGITLAGGIGTGVHGTHGWGYGSISRYVRSVRLVKADGTVQEYTNDGTDTWRALMTNLGALGYVSQLRIATRSNFNLKVRIDTFPESTLLAANGLLNLSSHQGNSCKYFILLWYPGPYTEQLVRLCGWETTEPVVSTAANILISPPVDPVLQQSFRASLQLGACYDDTMWTNESNQYGYFSSPANSPLVVNPDVPDIEMQHVTEIVGPWHRMIEWMFATDQVEWNQTDWEVTVPLDEFDAMVNDVEDYAEANDLAFSTIGAFIRIDQADDSSLLGANALGPYFTQGERVVHFEVPNFAPWDMAPDQRAAYEQRWVGMIQMLVDNYHVRPHWGKNQNWLFQDAAVMAENASRRARFQTILNAFDPGGVFARVHLARAGFTWPSGGNFDVDGDGMNEQTEIALGSDPDRYNGFRLRIDQADPSGDCRYHDTWSELETSAYGSPTHDYSVRAGWEFDVTPHNFVNAAYAWSPWPGGSGYTTWGARFSANFNFTQTGTYCFSVDNGATGTSITAGRNASLNVWYDQTRIAQTGYSTVGGSGASPRTGCFSVAQAGWHRVDISGRYHNANLGQKYKMRVRYCKATGSSCTPNLVVPQHLIEPI